MFQKILIANRGEIACRVIRTARRLGIATVAVYSDADRRALHVSMADEAVRIGPPRASESYLRGDRIIEACRLTGAEAVHPGYGFLSENAGFAEACEAAGIVFIGPPAGAIRAMGSKSEAKAIMEAAGVPLVPGYHGKEATAERLRQAAEAIGYPVLLKAASGGGGKGMRLVRAATDFDASLEAARREAKASFGDEKMLVERYIERPRHVEFQVFCDNHGNAVHLFERDCSIQRRHQKIIEEAPAPGMTPELRDEMGEAALRAARAIGYRGAGTVEFLLDGQGDFFFMEMNTRLQVEHPVTEMISGQDLVEWQIRVAAGESLPMVQEDLRIDGHAIEARIYAEDPVNDFLPASGVLTYLEPPREGAHVRVDSGVVQGDEVSMFYDPMIAKLVVHDETRARALARMTRALADYRISGLQTNRSFLYGLVTSAPYRAAQVDTHFIETHHDALFHRRDEDQLRDLPLASLFLLLRMEQATRARAGRYDPWSPWNDATAWRLNAPAWHQGAIVVNGTAHEVPVKERSGGRRRRFEITAGGRTVLASGRLDGNELFADIDGHRQRVTVAGDGETFTLFGPNGSLEFSLARPDFGADEDEAASDSSTAPMHGSVVKLLAEPGEDIEAGQPLLVLEAMKMEHTVCAHQEGTLDAFRVAPGDQVAPGDRLFEFTPGD
ncbi:MAG: acetyl/propionyl/methylcrotonyl-CoA carboxylase subunit alpha [Gammaproteobacteria bacterium]|nr:acetyl/propionyl/methylcrotonyl-CoA carboxylase subunit alpha [Gammaproteobacteria bacterium]